MGRRRSRSSSSSSGMSNLSFSSGMSSLSSSSSDASRKKKKARKDKKKKKDDKKHKDKVKDRSKKRDRDAKKVLSEPAEAAAAGAAPTSLSPPPPPTKTAADVPEPVAAPESAATAAVEEEEEICTDPSTAVDVTFPTRRQKNNDGGHFFSDSDSDGDLLPPDDDDDDDDGEIDQAALDALMAHATARGNAFLESQKREAEYIAERAAAQLSFVTTKSQAPNDWALALVSTQADDDDSHELQVAAAARKLGNVKPSAEDSKKILRLKYVNHKEVEYCTIEKDFYFPAPDIRALTEEEVAALLKELDGAQVKCKGEPPRPMRVWEAAGLPSSLQEVLETKGCTQPFAVQCVGMPVLMSGRDLIVTAKTGSGKTLMYVLPALRHAMHQERCKKGEGPIVLVLVPTQELAAQVATAAQPLADAVGLRVVQSDGSVPLGDNIKKCIAGCEVMIAVPGRLLDLLTCNNGKVLSLHRVSFVVVDEVDRMFDSGFMDHTEAFLKNIRPDRQMAFVSATMPPALRKRVKGHLDFPVEITVGGRPTPASNVTQDFYFFDELVFEADESKRTEDPRLIKLLQLIADMRDASHQQGMMMIFVRTNDECNGLFTKLHACGYTKQIAVLHAKLDPEDRQSALERFQPDDKYILISSAVGERGLDLAHLELVVNYDMPDHFEAYVHRIGRTGRAGKKGHAVSFFTRNRDDDIAEELIEGLQRAGQNIPQELEERAAVMQKKREQGLAPKRSSGYYKGYQRATKLVLTHDERTHLQQMAKASGLDEFLSSSDSEGGVMDDDDDDEEGGGARRGDPVIVRESDNATMTPSPAGSYQNGASAAQSSSALVVQGRNGSALVVRSQQQTQQDALAAAMKFAASVTDAAEKGAESKTRFRAEYSINEEPVYIRNRLQSSQLLKEIGEQTDTSIVRKGCYFDPRLRRSYKLKDGERPLHLLIHGFSVESVRAVFRLLDEAKAEAKEKANRKASITGAQL